MSHSKKCIVQHCNNKENLFIFPKDENKKKLWCSILKLDANISDKKLLLICVHHFESSDINKSAFKTRLRPFAVPKINLSTSTEISSSAITFVVSPSPQLMAPPTPTSHSNQDESLIQSSLNNHNNFSLKRKILDDHMLDSKKRKIDNKRKTIKYSAKKIKRYVKRHSSLKDALMEVNQNMEIDESLKQYLTSCADGK